MAIAGHKPAKTPTAKPKMNKNPHAGSTLDDIQAGAFNRAMALSIPDLAERKPVNNYPGSI